MRHLLKYAAIVIVAACIAVFSAWWGIFKLQDLSAVKNGIWRTNPNIGTAQADPYSRAFAAIKALFVLNKTETIYFQAFSDAAGETLSTNCDYTLVGKELDSRWWSIAVYGADGYLIPNKANRYSYTGKELTSDQKEFTIHLSMTYKEGNWLPTGDQGVFSIILRMYNPESKVYENLEAYELPKMIKEECR